MSPSSVRASNSSRPWLPGRARWACKVVWVTVVSVKSYCCVLLLFGLGLHCVMLVSCTPLIWQYSVQHPCSWIYFSPCGLLVSALHCTYISCHGYCLRNQGSTTRASVAATCKRFISLCSSKKCICSKSPAEGNKACNRRLSFSQR